MESTLLPRIFRRFIKASLFILVVLFYSNSSNAQCPVIAPVPNDACYQQVIAADSWCCNNAWDALCQSAYDACGPPPPCPVIAPVPNDACYQQVIAADAWCCNNAWDALCQASYDACAPATGPCASITPLIGCGTTTNAGMSGTGAGWNMTGCGGTTPGTELIFSFTATASGFHSLDISATTGGAVDFFWIDAASGCSSGAPWNCIGAVSTPGNYGSMNWVAGNTYYILLDPEGTGAYSFDFNVDCPNPGTPAVAGDCNVAIPVCTDLGFSIDPSGFGLVDELCTYCTTNPGTNPSSLNSGCLNSGELNSTWFTVNVAVGGDLEFSFGTPGQIGNCYDWIMWPMTPTACTDIQNNVLPPVTCNWNFPCDGFTGVSSVPPLGGEVGNFEPTMSVNAGDQFLICFSNYSSAFTTVPLNFYGTADISCTPLPVEIISFYGQEELGYNGLFWSTASEVNCSHFDIERSFDGVEFTKIGEAKGGGTILQQTDYRFNDYNAGSGVTYYRLKQVDFNNEFKTTNVIAITQHNQLSELSVISAYPNPASDQFTIQILLPQEGVVDLQIMDLNGRIINHFENPCVAGINSIDIPVANYPKGMYFITLLNKQTQKPEVVKLTVE